MKRKEARLGVTAQNILRNEQTRAVAQERLRYVEAVAWRRVFFVVGNVWLFCAGRCKKYGVASVRRILQRWIKSAVSGCRS